MNAFINEIFAFVCAQDPSHTWAPGGELLPACQRCTGLYVGAAVALFLLLWLRPPPGSRYRWLHVILLLLMAPFGFHLIPHGAVLRTMSGYWFGFGVVGLLWLSLDAKLPAKVSRMISSLKHYLISGAAGLILLLFVAIWGRSFAALILPWLAVAGMAGIAGLLVSNVLLFGNSIFAWFRRIAIVHHHE